MDFLPKVFFAKSAAANQWGGRTVRILNFLIPLVLFLSSALLLLVVFHGPFQLKLGNQLLFSFQDQWKLFFRLIVLTFLSLLFASLTLKKKDESCPLSAFTWALFAALSSLYLATMLGAGVPLSFFRPYFGWHNPFSVATLYFGVCYPLALLCFLLQQRRIPQPYFLLIFVPSFLLYLLNGFITFGGDVLYNTLLPRHLLDGKPFPFDWDFVDQIGQWGLIKIDRSFVPVWPIGASLFGLPTALLQKLLGVEGTPYAAGLNGKLTAAWVAALAAVFLFRILLLLLRSPRISALLTLAFVAASPQLTTSSLAMWQHGPGVFLICWGLYLLLKGQQEKNSALVLSAIPLSFLALVRPPTGIFFVAAFLFVLIWHHRRLCYFLLAALPGLICFLGYNYLIYGSLFGGYHGFVRQESFSLTPFPAMTGLLFSPNRGLFFLAPYLLFSLPGVFVAFRTKQFLAFTFGAAAFAYGILYFFWGEWWCGWSIGPRYLTECVPGLIVVTALFLRHYESVFMRRLSFAAVFWALVFTLPAGLFAEESTQWNIFPDINKNLQRVWDYHDIQSFHFLSRLRFERQNPVSPQIFIINERVSAVRTALGYAAVVKGTKRFLPLIKIRALYLHPGAYTLHLHGKGAVYTAISFHLQSQGVYLSSPIKVSGAAAFERSFSFFVPETKWLDLTIKTKGKGDLRLESLQLKRKKIS